MIVLSIAMRVGVTVTARGDDWPQWRGLHRDSVWHEKGILESFPGEGLQIRWRVPVGVGFSTPCVVQGRVYITDSRVTQDSTEENVRCLEGATGKAIWTHTYPVEYPEWGANPEHPFGPVATPVVVGGKIYTLGRVSNLICLDAVTGRVIWHNNLPKQYGTTEDLRGPNCSPTVVENLVIIAIAKSPQVSIVAFDKDSGRAVWEALDEIPSNSSPILIESGGRKQLIVWAYKSVAALDPGTGKILWRQEVNTGPAYTVATPVWKNDLLLLGGLMLKLNPDQPGSSILWPDELKPSRIHVSDTSTPFIQDGLVLSPTSKGQLQCLDPTTGRQLWQADNLTEPKSGASIHITAAPSINSHFLFTDRGDLILARCTSSAFREISRFHLLEPSQDYAGRKMAWTPPAYANRCVFARGDNELVCASLASKKALRTED